MLWFSVAVNGNEKDENMKTVSILAVTCVLLAPIASLADATVIANTKRTTITDNAEFSVLTEKISGETYPITTQPVFSFDCFRTNGWTVDASKRVSKVPDLGGGARYLTSSIDEINHSNYLYGGSLDLWIQDWKDINAPTLRASDGIVKGPYIDFGNPGSKRCLFFNPIEFADGTNWNKIANIGTVIGVYNSHGGSGQVLGGQQFLRHSGTAKNNCGTNRFEEIIYKTAGAATIDGYIWKNLQRNTMKFTYWAGSWEVVALNPNTATLEAHGVGVGDCHSPYHVYTTGGQSIAELMIFDDVLSDADIRKLIVYLNRKWLGDGFSGFNGNGRLSSLTMSDASSNLGAGATATIEVPSGEALTVDQVRGGCGSTAPQVIKTGAGSITVNDAGDFGGDIRLNAGKLAFSAKEVPAFWELPADMTLCFDPSDTNTLLVEDDAVAQWTNSLWSTRNVYGYMNTVARRPKFVKNELGEGLNVLDFGSRSDGTWAYLSWSGVPKFATVIAVVDTRIQGGGHFLEGNLQRSINWHNRNLSYATTFFGSADIRAVSSAWINGRLNDNDTEGYELPGWQVVAFRAPSQDGHPYYLGARYVVEGNPDAGGIRIGELIGYDRSLNEEEIRDVTAYLMKKWLKRTAPGYANASGTDVADVQEVIAASGTEISVPAGGVKTIETLSAADGNVVKSGEGKLILGSRSDVSGGLVVRSGSVAMTSGSDVSSKFEVAKDPILHLDATNAISCFYVPQNGTNFVAAWQDMTGRSSAVSPEIYTTRMPFLNTLDTLNGLPVIDFGDQIDNFSNSAGKYFKVYPQVENACALYAVYGSQAKGGQIFGSKNGTFYDFSRGSAPTLDTPFLINASDYLVAGEIYTNGVRVATKDARAFKPTGGYQLIELHPTRGLRFNTLATGGTPGYLHGGCRLGEVIVYERPLTEREKIATRNYLLKKWFNVADPDLTDLPAKPTSTAIPGDMTFDNNYTWDVAVKEDGTTDVTSVSGSFTFGANVTLNLSGLSSLENLAGRKITIASASSYSGIDNITVIGDVAFTGATNPSLKAGTNGELTVRFGRKGLVIMFR